MRIRASRPSGGNYHLPYVIDEGRIDAGTAAYRGFLFSDMRNFTAFAERFGNTAAAALVDKFLDLARTAIARHEGAEIKTEGDAIHAVFPSASSAVLCGLDIVDAAAELNAQQPNDHPLGLGVGVHAGEAVETPEGYIGRAVNIAARLCATAKPGEVLVSSTVKGITQSSIPVGFIPRGQRRLKGIADPIVVYAVTRDVNAKAPRSVPRPWILGGAGVALAVVVITVAALAAPQLVGRPSAAPVTTEPPAQRVIIGPLPIGRYTSTVFEPSVKFNIVTESWNATGDTASALGLVHIASPRGNVEFLRVDEVIESPCVPGGEGAQTGPSAADVITKLQALTGHLTVSDPITVRVGGFTGRKVDVSVADGALAACGGLAGSGASIFSVGGQTWSAASGERFNLWSIDVKGQAVTIVVSTDWTQTPSVQELQSLLVLGQQIIDSAAF
jgi:class 3 adenylate cyclase